MKHARILPLLLAFLFHQPSIATVKTLLTELIEDGLIDVQALGNGTHEGESVEVSVTSLSTSAISSSIPVGWVFISERPEVQDLLVVREEVFVLSPSATKTIMCRAFCCESSGSPPMESERYRAGRLADPSLVQVALACAARDYDDHAIQHAIWVVSDGHDIAGMGAMDSTLNDTLRNALSEINGQPVPRYSLHYAESDGAVCSRRLDRITRQLPLNLPNGATLTVVAITQDSKVREVLFDHVSLEPGRHMIELDVNVRDWPAGRYALRAHLDNASGVRLMPFHL